MIIGKEALVRLEHIAKQQYRVYPDSADIGAELTRSELTGIRNDVKTLKGIYSGVNYWPAQDYGGVKDIIIPLEECQHQDMDTNMWRCIVLNVLVSQQFKTVVFIEIETDILDESEIPFFSKVAAE